MTTKESANQIKQKSQQQAVDKDELQLAQLLSMGFSDEIQDRPRRLVLSLSGREKSGKSHFAFTAPDPIFLFNIDIGTEGVLDKFQIAGKKVYNYDVRVPKGAKKEVYESMWKDMKQRIEIVYKMSRGTLIVDTATEGFELARLAHFGKLTQVLPHNYAEVNSEWREFMRMAYDSAMNTVLIHKTKPKYINNIRTGEYEVAGFGETGYLVQCNATTYREQTPDGEIRFGLTIDDCRQNPSLCGQVLRGQPIPSSSTKLMVDPLCNFEMLLELVHG